MMYCDRTIEIWYSHLGIYTQVGGLANWGWCGPTRYVRETGAGGPLAVPGATDKIFRMARPRVPQPT